MSSTPRLGVVINPIAGMGGRVGLHGTDGAAVSVARARGASPVAPLRAGRALQRLRSAADVAVLTVAGEMGADVLRELGWSHRVVAEAAAPTSADDTRRAVAAMREEGVTLLLFVGGDGTARDIAEIVGSSVPVLGVPAGVKMHSGVFATSPEAAADVAARYLAAPERVGTTAAEVVDLVEGQPALLATARVPAGGGAVQNAKAGQRAEDEADLAALGHEVAAEMAPQRLYLLGPGTTVAHVNEALGLPATLLGVDAVLDGKLLGRDLEEDEIRELLAVHAQATLVLGVVGGQGFLLGRGNQQLSAAVIDALGSENIVILAAASKVAALDPPVLRVDLGDAAPIAPLSGYRQVRTAPGRSTVLRIAS
ncbi:MAG TPA: NAD(+)/NADH kinase [Jatrophihabitans sp.]|nr:NAD(+)/NADH kinase [Jatrophihabitans sp.]